MEFLTGNTPADALFTSTFPQQQQLDSLATSALSAGIDLYMNGDYDGAVRAFKRSIGLSPYSENTITAFDYMARAYLQLGETNKAIDTYKKSINLSPNRDDTHIILGNLYFGLNRYEEAEKEYAEAVRIYPSANNLFALGQVYLNTNRLNEAENIFSKVRSMEPGKPNGNYGLGLTYSKQGRYEKAIDAFEQAIRLDKDFYYAYAEIGYAYMDLGMKEEAKEVLATLEQKDPELSRTLSSYIYQMDAPNFTVAYYTAAFGTFPAKTPLSVIDTYFENANVSKVFSIKMTFDKEMDRESVENLANWEISRASGSGPGEAYNFGLPVPSTEVRIPSLPISVYYNAEAWTATVKFTVTQNSTADGTLDPSHVEFKFRGKDSYGLKMDTNGDQYSGFSGIA